MFIKLFPTPVTVFLFIIYFIIQVQYPLLIKDDTERLCSASDLPTTTVTVAHFSFLLIPQHISWLPLLISSFIFSFCLSSS